MMGLFNEALVLPTQNVSEGRFKGAEAISGERLNALTKQCRGKGKVAKGYMSACLMQCSGDFPDKNGRRVDKCPDFETPSGPSGAIPTLMT
jgi:aldehyde:ferredoxin oxidoreductase